MRTSPTVASPRSAATSLKALASCPAAGEPPRLTGCRMHAQQHVFIKPRFVAVFCNKLLGIAFLPCGW
jgi:hypothetical protein